jgi:hypothetical protein
MTTANSAIASIQSQLAAITSTLNGVMSIVDIGTENPTAGPVYESVLRRADKTRVNAYIDAYSSWVTLGSNPLTATNNTPNITVTKATTTVTISNASPALVTWTAIGLDEKDPVMFSTSGSLPTGLSINTIYYIRNKTANTFNVSATPSGALINTTSAGSGTHKGALGLVTGDLVSISGGIGGKGFSSGHIFGEFVVNAGATTSSFSFSTTVNATSGGSFGGSAVNIRRLNGRGMGTIWNSVDGGDTVVRTTSTGTSRYNFIIKANGDICYSTTVPLEVFATINAGGGSVICK